MTMQNSPVKFRRGNSETLPDEIKDGYISSDVTTGRLYMDIEEGEAKKRLAVNGSLYGVSTTEAALTTKIVDIAGVSSYFEGLIVTVIFTDIDKINVAPLYLSIVHGENVLPSVALMSNADTTISGVEIEVGVPYQFVYRNGVFVLNSGNVGSRPKWKTLTQNPGL